MDEQDLPEQFPDPTEGFTTHQRQWWDALVAGTSTVKQDVYNKVQSYREVVDVFRCTRGKAAGESFWQMRLRHKREANQNMQQNGIEPERIGKAEVQEYIGKGLDDIEAGKRPNVTGYTKERGCSEKHTRAVQRRDTTRSNEAAFAHHKEHPVLKLIADHGKVTDMHKGTVTRSLRKVGEQYSLAQRVALLEAQMKAQAELLERRFNIIESGKHWHSVALDLKEQGKGPTAIAELTGQRLNTVKQFLKRHRPSITTPTE